MAEKQRLHGERKVQWLFLVMDICVEKFNAARSKILVSLFFLNLIHGANK